MTDATIVLVADRLHAIHQTISGVTASRYFPRNFDSAVLPLVTAVPGRRVRDTESVGRREDLSVRTWDVVLFVDNWMGGLPTETAQADTETLMDTLSDTYLARPLLELNGASLPGVLSAVLTEDTGVLTLEGDNAIALVRFSLVITTLKQFEFATT